MAFWLGKDSHARGQPMIERSASSGFPTAVVLCHYVGMKGWACRKKKAFDMWVKIEHAIISVVSHNTSHRLLLLLLHDTTNSAC
jgi:hypothetical protein